MNFVKGAAGFIRRSSAGNVPEPVSGSSHERFSAPKPQIRFSDVGDEGILNSLWRGYENTLDEAQKKRLLQIFLRQFISMYRNWEPIDLGQFPEAASPAAQSLENLKQLDEVVVGCSTGHPTEVILALIEEVKNITALITELNVSGVLSTTSQLGPSPCLSMTSECLPILDALTIITRSMHNCRVFGYYGGVLKLAAFMKAAVVQLKTITSALSADETVSNYVIEKTRILQTILLHVVSILWTFLNLRSDAYEKIQSYREMGGFFVSEESASSVAPSSGMKDPFSEGRNHWHQKAVVSVMEAGGLNWLVELLRVSRRLNMKEQWMDTSLMWLTLRTLQSALADNSRGQNHFRSIGGLEVLLDGLGVSSTTALRSKILSCTNNRGEGNLLLDVLQLHVLSLKVLREAVFGNLYNLQFLYENGRVPKFANNFCSPAYMFQECKQQGTDLNVRDDLRAPLSDIHDKNDAEFRDTEATGSVSVNHFFIQYWNDYVVRLSRGLFSFLLPSEDVTSHNAQILAVRCNMPASGVYAELSVRWIMRVLLMVFPCLKASSNQNEFPSHVRIFVYTLQHHVLFIFKRVLVLSPLLLDVFRAEGVWEFIFSENFFYFGSALAEYLAEYCEYNKAFSLSLEHYSGLDVAGNQLNSCETNTLQNEVVLFVQFAATLNGSSHNMPECSILLDALEQCACSFEIASVLARGLLHILQLSAEKTISSFKKLDAIPRVLKVACIQGQEFRSGSVTSYTGSNDANVMASQSHEGFHSPKRAQSCFECMEISVELFVKYFSVTDDAKSLVLHSYTCIDCLFDLFWEKNFRNRVLAYIFELMKIIPFSEEDRKAKLYLCSKYLETFTHIKEREKNFAELSIDLLVGIRDMLLIDEEYYQVLFRDGECFLHIVSLLNVNLDVAKGEELVLNVLQTLTGLLARNDASKAALGALLGKGYQTLQRLLLDFCQCRPSEGLLNAVLDMLVDGKFDLKEGPVIKNEDDILLYLSILQKSNDSLRNFGLNVFLQLLRDSLSNRASCVRAGMLNFLLDWFSQEDNDVVLLKIAQLIQVTGGHSISGKDIRKIFALLRSEKIGSQLQYCSLLLTSILSMLNEKGPTAFFDLNGNDSGITIRTPVQWPLYKGFSFSCWVRIESFPQSGTMGLFSFLTENGKGCLAVLTNDKLIYESLYQKRQSVSLHVNLVRKKWHFLCLTHSIGRAFSGGSQLRCFVDGVLASSERCSYAKVNENLTNCTVGTKLKLNFYEEENAMYSRKETYPFHGQIGPVYMFSDAISSEQVQGIFSLGPSYMYSFLDNETTFYSDNSLPGGIFDAREGLASRIIFGLNAQASNGRRLFNVSPVLDSSFNKNLFEATVTLGTQLCSRRLLQEIIYCVGGVSVFFPLFIRSDLHESEENGQARQNLLTPITKERLTAEIIELIASFLDENLANQQQMLRLSGFSILGLLLQSVPPQQLNLETLSALKHMFNVVASCGMSELLIKEAISHIFLNPHIWVHTVYKAQRELYMFLIQQFDGDPRLLKSFCCLPRVLDIIRQFYWDDPKCQFVAGSKPPQYPLTNQVIAERPSKEERHKIRLLVLSLGEMSLRENIAVSDIKSLIAFFETSQDMACIEDVLHMVIRAVSQKSLLASFLEQVNLIGGCHIFVNLLQRDFEPIRLLSLQFLGRLLVGLPSEKKGSKFFNISVGRSKPLSDVHKRISSRMQPIFPAILDRLFRFPLTEHLRATLFDILLGGASPKQALQKHNQLDWQRSWGSDTQFFLPQILVLIFRFLSGCGNVYARVKILGDLLDLLDSNPLNIEALMEHGWNAWLAASANLDILRNYKLESRVQDDSEMNEQNLVRNLFHIVLCHCVHSLKGGWQHLEETVNFLLLQCEQEGISFRYLLRDIYEDLIQRLIDLSSDENILILQPCRDNALYLLKLIDEFLIYEIDYKLPYPSSTLDSSDDILNLESCKDLSSALHEALQGELGDHLSRNPGLTKQHITTDDEKVDDEWWNLYDNLWVIICALNGKGPMKVLPKSSSPVGPSFGQRARGLVESLNIPAAEVAAVVVSGGISNALSGKPIKNVDKAMLLRAEKCPRIVYRLMILYLCKSSLKRASRCVQLVIPLLPCLLAADDEQTKSRLQLFIWALLAVRSQYAMLDDGARFHVISHLIRETVNCGKSVLATTIMNRDDLLDSGSNVKETGTIQNLIQKDRVLVGVADEIKYIKNSTSDRSRQVQNLHIRMDENMSKDSNQKKFFEDELQSSLNSILASDDSRRASFQLAYDEEQQIVAGKWIHTFRALIDERGPWSANPLPNSPITRWKLDKTEDAWRRRQKLRRNYHFDEKLCHPGSSIASNESFPTNESKSGLGVQIPEQMKKLLLKGIRKITDEGSLEPSDSDAESSGQNLPVPEEAADLQDSEVPKSGSDQKDVTQERKDHSMTSESESTEVLLSVPCVLVTPKRKLAGHLAVMKKFLHFFGEFLVEGTGGSSIFKKFNTTGSSNSSVPDDSGVEKKKFHGWSLDLDSERINIININAVNGDVFHKQPNKIKRYRRWNISKIKAVHWTRYLLRHTAIEIFFYDSVTPIFLNFATQKDAKDVGTLVVATRNESLFPKGYKDKAGVIYFVDRRVAMDMAEAARERWRRREITNFQYLMILNTLSGRSYNDLTQYPVFPWILADYSSETLDFNKSSTFRDLSKPVGALDSKRFEVFEERYRNFSDPDIPSFYYGSHYSSMGIVLFYLLRLEPFTALHRNLQGGKFDHADRLFHSIEGTYRNCLSNTSDVKELIPEFFYMPEFLVNLNSYHFGTKQDGEPLSDVCLPPWAKGSSEEFVNKNREALESEYVSSNLHHWIDLVFGYKQRAKPAVEAANVFYYLTYEGAVDMDTMEDKLQRAAIEDQIANFGQTPIQIFRKKHPRRGPPIPIANPLRFAPSSINLTSIVLSTSNSPSAVLYVNTFDSNIVLVDQELTMSVKLWLTTQLQSGGNFTFSGSQDPFFGIGSDVFSPHKIGSPLAENVELGAQFFSTLQMPSENFLISCGNWENSFQVISLSDGRMVQSIRQHKDVVSCVAVTSDGSIIATGSYDTTIMVWEIFRTKAPDKRVRTTQSDMPRKDYVIVETPFHILCGHDDIITCLFVSVELDIVISGSKDGTCVFHTLHEGRYVRSLHHPSGCALSKLVASRHGQIVLYAEDDLSLHLYSINGKHIATSESNGRLNCVELSGCGEFLVCAGDQGQIVVRSMNSLEIVQRYNGVGKVITSLVVTPEECFLAGTKDGCLLVYSIENHQLRKTNIPRNVKTKASVT